MYDSESDSSVTKATLTEGKITLNKDSQPTETTAEALGLNTDLNQANKQVEATFDIKQKLKDQQVLSAAVGDIGAAAQAYTESKAKELNQEAEELEKAGKVAEAIQKKEEAEKWQTSGEYKRKVDAVTTAISLAIAGKPTEAVVAGAASPYVNRAIKQLTEQSESANIAAHVLWGAIEAELAGGKASTGAVAAGAAEIGARVLTQGLYEKEPHELTTEEKEEVLALSKALAGLASGAVNGGSSVETLNAVSTGVEVAKNAVENNALSSKDVAALYRDIRKAIENGEDVEAVYKHYRQLSQAQREALLSDCGESCRLPVEGMLGNATELAADYSGLIWGWMSGLSTEERSRFLTLVEEENTKSINALKARHSFAENALEFGVNAAQIVGKERLGHKPTQVDFAKKSNKVDRGSAIPYPNPEKVQIADKEVTYKSNAKHTKGMPGNRPNAGIEPRNSLELFRNSVVDGKKRYSIDSQGNIHQFNSNKEGTEWHWAGRTGRDQPASQILDTKNISNDILKKLGTTEKEVRKK
nr:VENN motif pre-toxin domain-containing protein [Actinobacillus suis]